MQENPVRVEKVSELCGTQQSSQSRMKSARKSLITKEKTLKPIKELHSDKEDQVEKKTPKINSQNKEESKR